MKTIILMVLACLGAYAYMTFAGTLPAIGQPAPAFSLPDSQNKSHRLADYAGKWLVLYFYPKDDTPACTKEACHFRDDFFALESLGAKVVGISVDDSKAHAKFAEKYSLPFPLLSDMDGKVADSYGALSNFGVIKFAKRYTFLINPQGNIAKIYQDVDTSRHSQQIIDDLKQALNK